MMLIISHLLKTGFVMLVKNVGGFVAESLFQCLPSDLEW